MTRRATAFSERDAQRVAAFTRGMEHEPKGRARRRGWRPTAPVVRYVFVYDTVPAGNLYRANIGEWYEGVGALTGEFVGSSGLCWARPMNSEELSSKWYRGLLVGETADVPVYGVHCCQTEAVPPGSGSGSGSGFPLSCCGEAILSIPTLTAVRTRGATTCTASLTNAGFKTVSGQFSFRTFGGGIDFRYDLTGYWWEEDPTEYAATCEADFPGGRIVLVAATNWASTPGGTQHDFSPPSWPTCVMDFMGPTGFFGNSYYGPDFVTGCFQDCFRTSATASPATGRDFDLVIS